MPTRERRAREKARREAAAKEAAAKEAAQGAAAATGAPISDGIDDPPPAPSRRRRGRPPGSRNTASRDAKTQEIASALTKVLVMPSFAFGFTGDDWAVKHFEENGPVLAQALAKHSETNPQLRKLLEKIAVGDANYGLILALAVYLLPPMMYFGVIPAPQAARTMLDVPYREEVRGPSIADTMMQATGGIPGDQYQQPMQSQPVGVQPTQFGPQGGEFSHPPAVAHEAHRVS